MAKPTKRNWITIGVIVAVIAIAAILIVVNYDAVYEFFHGVTPEEAEMAPWLK